MTDTTLAVAFALANAFTVSFLNLIVRFAGRHANAATGVLIGLLVGLPFMAGAALWLWEPGWWNWKAWALFAASGAIGPSVARVFYFLSIHRLGVPRAVPLISTMPLAAAAMGMAFLGERPGPVVLAGTLLVVVGCMAITSKRGGDKSWSRRDLWLPFASVVTFTLSHVWRKMGLALVPSPILGLTVMSVAGAVCLYLFGGLLSKEQRPRLGTWRAWRIYGVAGLFNAGSVLLHFYALKHGDLTVVIPLASTAPFFSLVLSWIFLRGTDQVTGWIVAGTVLVVLGGALITWREL
ncbi:MAG: DMT family transporter [Candidatus Tectomicrobia bacterium]|nr:DMT family transporter [Candidatus Tectomicrobia bacterium]